MSSTSEPHNYIYNFQMVYVIWSLKKKILLNTLKKPFDPSNCSYLTIYYYNNLTDNVASNQNYLFHQPFIVFLILFSL